MKMTAFLCVLVCLCDMILWPIFLVCNYDDMMLRCCGRRYFKKWVYLQIYVSLVLLCLAGYFLVQMLYCQSQLGMISSFRLDLYACNDLCPNYQVTNNSYLCCSDSTYYNCVNKYSCMEGMVTTFSNMENTNGIIMACLVSSVPFLALLHLVLRLWRQRRLRERAQEIPQTRVGMPTLQSFLHDDPSNQCSICLLQFNKDKAIALNCGHVFHNQCIRQWGSRKKTCPICRNTQT